MMSNIEKSDYNSFDRLKHSESDSGEFWYARELQIVLDYSSWDKFKRAVLKAIKACENSKQDVEDRFFQVGKMVELGSGSQREVQDYKLSRYVCYPIFQNHGYKGQNTANKIGMSA